MIKKSCAIILSVICGVVVVVFSDSAALSSGNETHGHMIRHMKAPGM